MIFAAPQGAHDEKLRDLNRRLSTLLSRGVVRHADVQAGMATPQAEFFAGEVRRVEMPQNFGFASALLEGAEIFGAFANGDRSAGIALASEDRRYRPLDLEAGEVAVYGTGARSAPWHWIKFTDQPKAGTIKIKAARIEIRAGQNFVLIDSDLAIGMQKGIHDPAAELPLNPGGAAL